MRTVASVIVLVSDKVPAALADVLGGACRLAVVANAKDAQGSEARDRKVMQDTSALTGLGFDTVELDLRCCNEAQVGAALRSVDGVWVCGGDTSVLVDAMTLNGFDRAVRSAVRAGLHYIGESAGAMVAGTSIEHLHLLGDPRRRPPAPPIGLVTGSVWPHWDSEQYAEIQSELERRAGADDHAIRLRDGEWSTYDHHGSPMGGPAAHGL